MDCELERWRLRRSFLVLFAGMHGAECRSLWIHMVRHHDCGVDGGDAAQDARADDLFWRNHFGVL